VFPLFEIDRCNYKLGKDPVVKTTSDLHSFGFIKNRSTHDAIRSIRSIFDKYNHPRWIQDADISKCFDRISHQFLMEPIAHKVILPPRTLLIRRRREQWLKCGYKTEAGTPQWSILSPTLCNVTLNGLWIIKINLIKYKVPHKKKGDTLSKSSSCN